MRVGYKALFPPTSPSPSRALATTSAASATMVRLFACPSRLFHWNLLCLRFLLNALLPKSMVCVSDIFPVSDEILACRVCLSSALRLFGSPSRLSFWKFLPLSFLLIGLGNKWAALHRGSSSGHKDWKYWWLVFESSRLPLVRNNAGYVVLCKFVVWVVKVVFTQPSA